MAMNDSGINVEKASAIVNPSVVVNGAPPIGGVGPASEDTGSTITVNTKAPPNFPPPKTDKPRPHVCATCQRSFARLEHLKRHERSHTKEKPFECPECTRCFARRDLLLRHQQKLHQTTTPSARPRNRRESTSSVAQVQSRARKNSVVGMNPAAAAASASMRPRANTISHVDGANAMQLMAAASAPAVVRMPMTHSRHPSLAGLPLHHTMDHNFGGMSVALGQRGMAHGLPKLETTSIGNMDFTSGLRTAPVMPFNTDFDFGLYLGASTTINPNALHYNDSPQSMALDPTSPFSHTLGDLGVTQHMEDTFDWLTGFEQHMSFTGNETAVDGSSPSAISTTSQSGLSDVMLDGSNHPAPVTTAPLWPQSGLAPHQMSNPFALDLSGTVFPDLMNGAPISPQPSTQKVNDAYFSTPPPSMSSLSPTVVNGLTSHNMSQALAFNTAPETPSSLTGAGAQGLSPVSSINDTIRNAIVNALSQRSPLGLKFSFPASTSPISPQFQTSPTTSSDSLNLPATHDLQKFVGAYVRYFHPHLPFLHIPTLSFEVAPTTVNQAGKVGDTGCLLLSMATIGALYEGEVALSRELFELAKKMLTVYLEERRKANVRKADFQRTPATEQGPQNTDRDDDTPLWLVQAMLLNVIYGHNCGDKTAADIASTHMSALVSLAKAANLLQPTPAEADAQDVHMGDDAAWSGAKSETDEHAEWLRWKTVEERRRTLHAIFTMSSFLVSAYNHHPALNNSDIQLDLPCEEEFFSAESSASFHAKGGAAAANRNPVTFHKALGSLLQANEHQQRQQSFNGNTGNPNGSDFELRPSTFGCLILIHALHNYIWETRQRHHGKVWTVEEIDTMHRHIEPALKAWQTAWASNPHHSIERPNPYGMGPLSADSIPLLDLAYVKLFVSLSRAKDKFWQRDWKGMAEELALDMEHLDPTPEAQGEMGGFDGLDSLTNHNIIDSPVTALCSSPEFTTGKFQTQSSSTGQGSNRSTSRRERHLRKAAFYAADSLSVSDKLGVTFADFTSRELPLQSAMCAFDCAEVLAEWVATLQDRVGRYLGILGQDDVDLAQVPAIMLLEEEDLKLLDKISEVLNSAEMKLNAEAANSNSVYPWHRSDKGGFAYNILHITAHMLEKAAVWPLTHLMAQCIESQASIMQNRAEKSVLLCE